MGGLGLMLTTSNGSFTLSLQGRPRSPQDSKLVTATIFQNGVAFFALLCLIQGLDSGCFLALPDIRWTAFYSLSASPLQESDPFPWWSFGLHRWPLCLGCLPSSCAVPEPGTLIPFKLGVRVQGGGTRDPRFTRGRMQQMWHFG
jgi:hypothetical protein